MSKNAFLRNCFAFTLLLIFSANANAQINWVGATSTDWATGSNWSTGAVPGALDNVQIGVAHFNFQPTLSGTTSVRNLTFGGNVPVILTILANDTLKVINKIVQNHSGDGLAPSTLITGAGGITCASVMVGDLTSPRFVQSKTSTLASKISAFVVTGSIDLNSVTENLLTGGVANNNSFFSLQGGTLLLGGKINTISRLPQNCNSFGTNNPNSRFSIDINSNQDAVLKLTDSSAVNISNPNYATIDFYNHISDTGRSRVEYIGANQLLYTNTVAGVDVSPSNYQDLTISGTGIKTAGTDSTSNQLNISGNLRINSSTLDLKKYAPQTVVAGNFRNTGTVNFGTGTTTINGASFFNSGGFNQYSGVIQFAGTAQSLVDSTLTGTNFRRVGFYHNSTKSIQLGKFAVVPNGKVRLLDTALLNVVTGASLTIRSDSTGEAGIAALTGGCKVMGIVNIEYYIQGSIYLHNNSARGYRLITSPVNYTGTLTGDRSYNVDFLKGTNSTNGLLTTGPTGGGFDVEGANPFFYLVREDINYSNACLLCGNNKGVLKMNYTDPNLIGTQSRFSNSSVPDTIVTIPVGLSLFVAFRGNKVNPNGTSTGTKTIAPYNWPENVTLTSKGTANQGEVKFREWYRNDYILSYTNSPSISNASLRGMTRLGNPYPSSINLDNLSTTDSTSNLYGPNLSTTFYVYDNVTGQDFAYQADPSHDRTQIYHGTGSMTNIIGISKGFQVVVDPSSPNPYAASMTIREGAKFDSDAASWPTVPAFMTGFALAQNQSNSRGIKKPLSLAIIPAKSIGGLSSNNISGNKTSTKNTLHTSANLGNRKKISTSTQDQFFRLKLIQDASKYDDILIRFSGSAKDMYDPKEDAFDLGGTEEATTMLSSYSSDHIPLAINKLPFPVRTKNILLFTDAKESGAYSLKASDLQNIPSNYNIRLKDKLNGRIINLRFTDHYDFNIDKTVAASFGDRFEVIITNGIKN